MNFTKIENGKRVINNDAILNFTDEMYSQYQLDTTKEVPFISRLYNLIEAVILELKIFEHSNNYITENICFNPYRLLKSLPSLA